jgi:SET domain-containing protein
MAVKKVRAKKSTFSWMNPGLEVRNTKVYGKGIFANKKIKKGDLLSVFGGYVRSIKEEEALPNDFNDNGVQISENLVLTILKKSELEDASYFNHSCNPNAGFNGQIFLVAMVDIQKDSEVTFDYAMALHHSKNASVFKMDCSCDSIGCRKVITENDWKKSDIQKKYNGYFQWYLQNKINKK